jgi:hypothetical protein
VLSRDGLSSPQGHPHRLLYLQQILGNHNVARLIQSQRVTAQGRIRALQPTPRAGAARDKFEKEPERVAVGIRRRNASDRQASSPAQAEVVAQEAFPPEAGTQRDRSDEPTSRRLRQIESRQLHQRYANGPVVAKPNPNTCSVSPVHRHPAKVSLQRKNVPSLQRATEYHAGAAINVTYTVPLARNIEASRGEQLIFGIVEANDSDRQRSTGGGAWTTYTGVGPYETKYMVSGDAEFDSAGSGTTEVIRHSLTSTNIYLFIKNSWNGRRDITVTATIKDNVPNPTAPDTGSAKDSDVTVTWTIKKRRGPCPTGLRKVSGSGAVWTAAPASYGYEATPDRPPAGRPDYEGQTVLESFGTITALGFTMNDLTTAWKAANPGLTTPDQVAASIWNAGDNGTFVFDNQDRIYDQHSGFGKKSPFEASAFTDADGVGWSLSQTYSCGGTTIGTATIDRRFTTTNGLEIKKTGP